jgi:hypothetical protein
MKIEIDSFDFHGNYGTDALPCQCRTRSAQQMCMVWQKGPGINLKTAHLQQENSGDEPERDLRNKRCCD